MLEPIYYYIGRICKDLYFNEENTPKLISETIINNINSPIIKIPFDAPKELFDYLFEQNKNKLKGTIKLENNENNNKNNKNNKKTEINYYILNVGKYIDKLEEIKEDLQNSDLIIIADSRRLIERKELLLLKELRNIISPNCAIYFPGTLPYEIPLLTYMGVDYFDNSSAYYYTIKGEKFTKNRIISIDDSNNDNNSNNSDNNNNNIEKYNNELLNHNLKVIDEILEETKYCIKNGSLRNLVEETTLSHPYLRSNYKRYNPELTDLPLSTGNKLIVSIDETTIPEVKKYVERVINYEPYTNTIVLLPCSAKKPYSQSKSHQYFINTIRSSKIIVEELILTSPYGIVPRAFEEIINYDIPVIGQWSYEEIQFINKYLKIYLDNAIDKFGTISVIAHLPNHYYEIIDKKLIEKYDIINTVEDNNPTSNNSLSNLKYALDTLEKEQNNEEQEEIDKGENCNVNTIICYTKSNLKKQKIHNYQQLAKLQFGANFIPDNVVIKGRHKKFFVNINGQLKQICSLNYENGLFVLTTDGGKLLGKHNWVEVDFKPKKGSLFSPGFKDCEDKISVGDDVVIIYNNNIVGVGRALLSGKNMKKAKFGSLLNIRHCEK